jgi:esterase
MKLFFRKYGEGAPLVILHGLYGSSDNWVTIARNLSNRFTVILPDLRNHGQSPHSTVHDYNSMRDDLYELVSDLNIRKFFLAGHSMGGKAAAAFAVKWPEKLYGLLIADISPFTDGNERVIEYNQHLNILSAILSIDLSAVKSRGEAEIILNEKISSERITGFLLKNLQRGADGSYSWKLNALSLFNNLKEIMSPVIPDKDTEIPVTGFPVTVLKAGLSAYITPSDIIDIRKVFPASEFRVIQGAGHWVHADKPEEVITALRELCGDE